MDDSTNTSSSPHPLQPPALPLPPPTFEAPATAVGAVAGSPNQNQNQNPTLPLTLPLLSSAVAGAPGPLLALLAAIAASAKMSSTLFNGGLGLASPTAVSTQHSGVADDRTLKHEPSHADERIVHSASEKLEWAEQQQQRSLTTAELPTACGGSCAIGGGDGKALRCPHCNWSYKYTQTLELHMRERHPEHAGAATAIVIGPPLPPSASATASAVYAKRERDEELGGGVGATVPAHGFWCEVCAYWTPSKGNMGIHLQSDKHLHNVFQHGPTVAAASFAHTQTRTQTQTHTLPNATKQTRHEPCAEAFSRLNAQPPTNEFTEHNVWHRIERSAALEVNERHDEIAVNSVLEQEEKSAPSGELSGVFACDLCGVFCSDSLAALAEHVQRDRTDGGRAAKARNGCTSGQAPLSAPLSTNEMQRANANPDLVFIGRGQFECRLCSYRTHLKANFQLHLKTDKHLQRLQLVNHLREGGADNERKVRALVAHYTGGSNAPLPAPLASWSQVSVRCVPCDLCTNSLHKLELHLVTPEHAHCETLYRHICSLERLQSLSSSGGPQKPEPSPDAAEDASASTSPSVKLLQVSDGTGAGAARFLYMCSLCGVSERTRAALVHHAAGEQHRVALASQSQSQTATEPDVEGAQPAPNPLAALCVRVLPSTPTSGDPDVKEHFASNGSERVAAGGGRLLNCPLCQHQLCGRHLLREHLVQAHRATPAGVEKLLMLVNAGGERASPSSEAGDYGGQYEMQTRTLQEVGGTHVAQTASGGVVDRSQHQWAAASASLAKTLRASWLEQRAPQSVLASGSATGTSSSSSCPFPFGLPIPSFAYCAEFLGAVGALHRRSASGTAAAGERELSGSPSRTPLDEREPDDELLEGGEQLATAKGCRVRMSSSFRRCLFQYGLDTSRLLLESIDTPRVSRDERFRADESVDRQQLEKSADSDASNAPIAITSTTEISADANENSTGDTQVNTSNSARRRYRCSECASSYSTLELCRLHAELAHGLFLPHALVDSLGHQMRTQLERRRLSLPANAAAPFEPYAAIRTDADTPETPFQFQLHMGHHMHASSASSASAGVAVAADQPDGPNVNSLALPGRPNYPVAADAFEDKEHKYSHSNSDGARTQVDGASRLQTETGVAAAAAGHLTGSESAAAEQLEAADQKPVAPLDLSSASPSASASAGSSNSQAINRTAPPLASASSNELHLQGDEADRKADTHLFAFGCSTDAARQPLSVFSTFAGSQQRTAPAPPPQQVFFSGAMADALRAPLLQSAAHTGIGLSTSLKREPHADSAVSAATPVPVVTRFDCERERERAESAGRWRTASGSGGGGGGGGQAMAMAAAAAGHSSSVASASAASAAQGMGMGLRASRTRFSEEQLRVMRHHYDTCCTAPKELELEQLARTLGLSQRIVLVWFQNYRQKVQKQQLLASIKANKLETCGELREADLRGGEMASVLQSRSPHSSRQSSDSMLDAACGGWLPADNVDQNQSDGCPVLSRSRSRSRSGESLSSGGAFVDSAEQEERHSSVIGASLGLAGGRSESLLLADPHYTGTSGCAAAAAAAAAMRRQRTSISAEQFDYLSAQYARLTHPTQEQLEHMSRRTGLHRRVVQVWFQNARARTRKEMLMRNGDGGAGEQQSSDLKLLHSCAGAHQLSPQSSGFKRSNSFGETSPVAAKLPRLTAAGLSDVAAAAAVVRTNGSVGGANGSRHMSTSSAQPQPALECSFCQQSGFANAFALNLHVSSAHPREQLLKLLSSGMAAAAGNKSGQPLLSPTLATSPELLTMMAAAAATATTLSLNLQGSSASAPNALMPNPLSLLLGAAMGAAAGSGGGERSATSGSGVNGNSSAHNQAAASGANGVGRSSASLSAATGRLQSLSSAAVSPSDGAQGHARRTRTQLSAFQVAVLSAVYSTHKCPSVRECGFLGDELGLPGRVVQVWFQNTRAKERKQLEQQQQQQRTGGFGDTVAQTNDPPPEFCEQCRVPLVDSVARQEHTFSRAHIERLKSTFAHLPRALLYNGGTAAAVTAAGAQAQQQRHRLLASAAAGVQLQLQQLQALRSQRLGLVAGARGSDGEREPTSATMPMQMPMPPTGLLPSPSPSPSSRGDEPMDTKPDVDMSPMPDEPHEHNPHWDSADYRDVADDAEAEAEMEEAEGLSPLDEDMNPSSDELSEREENIELIDGDGPMDFSDNTSRHTSISAAGLAS